MLAEETTYYLEMTDPGQLRPKPAPGPGVDIALVADACPELNRFFYTAVGGDWYWIDRLPWTYAQWLAYLARPCLQTWVLSVAGVPAGYFELEGDPGADIEIAYFGLLPQFVGRTLGGHLLTEAVRRAWERPAARVWVHTSSFDHPAALPNYLARGFRLYKQERSVKDLPDRPPGPWPGARP
ncbi:MAG: GNAT family N-acetyltransferase [Thermoguttaceae bacterium]|jgi:GNAT superfamily N-acetyltransferase|nr:GNAT family N-acetyltransferase [Thermoguttaceae bacterium]